MVIFLERGADLHIAQPMPVPLTVSCSSVSCSSKIQIGFTFVVPAHLGSPGQRAVKRVCVCVTCILYMQPVAAHFVVCICLCTLRTPVSCEKMTETASNQLQCCLGAGRCGPRNH